MLSSMGMLDFAQLDPAQRRPITRAEFRVMDEAGLFDQERVELLDGVIVRMPPSSVPHDLPIERLSELILPPLVGRARVRVQLRFVASEYTEAAPDLAIIHKDAPREDHPTAALLLIEVAYSSLRFDRTAKASIYARANASAYWIVNVTERTVEAYTEPVAGQYTQTETHSGADRLVIPGFPDVTFSVDDVFA